MSVHGEIAYLDPDFAHDAERQQPGEPEPSWAAFVIAWALLIIGCIVFVVGLGASLRWLLRFLD